MSFFKSKFFIVTVLVAVFLTVVVSAMSLFGYSSVLRSAVNFVITPVQRGFDYIGQSLDGYSAYITEFDRLKADNEALRQELDTLRDEVYGAQALIEQNEFYKNYLEIKDAHLDYKFCDAEVIGREAGNFFTIFSLNKGSSSSVDVNMPIIASNGGLIGYISEAGVNWSKASSLLDSSSSVGVYCERSLATGIVSGDYTLKRSGLCKMEYISENADIKVGDRVVTSGLGSIYPRGLTVGIIEQIETDDNLRTQYAIIRPYADLTELEMVMVVTEFDRYSE